jgi:phosphocarrier protein
VKSSQTENIKTVLVCPLERNIQKASDLAIFLIDEGYLLAYNIQEICKTTFLFQLVREFAMYVKSVKVQNQVGLHARPATFFIQKANEFKSSIWVEKDERRVNAKSLLGVLSLGIMGGTDIKIMAGGSDEEEAVDALVALVESGFAE